MIRGIWLLVALGASAQTIHFSPVLSPIIERRLAAVPNTNIDRERTLHDLFTEVGCSDVKLVEQAVKSSKVPNVICALEGKIESIIVVGAHFETRSPRLVPENLGEDFVFAKFRHAVVALAVKAFVRGVGNQRHEPFA